jgi:hypothetical protein
LTFTFEQLQEWAFRLIPALTFDDFIEKARIPTMIDSYKEKLHKL